MFFEIQSKCFRTQEQTRQVYNLFQDPVEQPPLDFDVAKEKLDSFKNQTGYSQLEDQQVAPPTLNYNKDSEKYINHVC